MFEAGAILIIVATLLLAGVVKGVIGLGLPSISLALLAATFDLITAMALMLLPSLVTNLIQAFRGGHGQLLSRRLWPFFTLATLTIWLGAAGLSTFSHHWLTALLGILLTCYAIVNLAGLRMSLSPQQEKIAGPIFGVFNGLFTGLTGAFVVPGVPFLQAIGLPREQLVQAMGILFSLSTIALAITLQQSGYLSLQLGLWSLIGIVPAVIGMQLGQRIRQRLSEPAFRKTFFLSLLLLGFFIVAKSI